MIASNLRRSSRLAISEIYGSLSAVTLTQMYAISTCLTPLRHRISTAFQKVPQLPVVPRDLRGAKDFGLVFFWELLASLDGKYKNTFVLLGVGMLRGLLHA